MKTCIACGMPMNDVSDFAMNDFAKDYCAHCAKEDGSMQSFDEKKENFANFIVKTQGLDKTVALDAAENMMRELPAWVDHFMNS